MLNTILFYAVMLLVVGVPFYFQYQIQNSLTQFTTPAEATPKINSLTAKLSLFLIAALYFMSFLALEIKNSAYSKVGFGSCFLSIFLLYSFRGKLIHKIREVPADHMEQFRRSLRTFIALGGLYGIYFATVHFLIPFTGTLPAIAAALLFIIYSTPIFVRIWMPTQKMHPSPLKEDIFAVFKLADSRIHQIYLIDTDRFKSYNALVCGPKYGFGPFQRSLFITQNLFEVLEPEEIMAVVCHEASHFKLHHVAKRGLMSFVGLLIGMFAVTLPAGFLGIIVNTPLYDHFALTSITVLGCIAVQMFFLQRVVRKQEFEADFEALNLGAAPHSLISALEKITFKNGSPRVKEDTLSRLMLGHAHPSTEERVNALQSRQLPSDSKVLPDLKWCVGYASVVVMLGAFAMIRFDSKVNRQIASIETENTRQKLPPSNNTLNERGSETER